MLVSAKITQVLGMPADAKIDDVVRAIQNRRGGLDLDRLKRSMKAGVWWVIAESDLDADLESMVEIVSWRL